MKNKFKIFYEIIMLFLVILTILSLWEENNNTVINWGVWAVFTVDFLIRIYLSDNKWEFVKKHPFLVIAIIPFDQFFQVARIVRLVYLFRIKTIAKYYVNPIVEKLSYKSLTYVVLIILGYITIVALIIWKLEETVDTLLQAIIISFGYLMFFGREIFTIEHTFSTFLLIATSIIGVILQGLALQWAFSKAEVYYHKLRKNDEHFKRKSS